ncbi:MAG: hypothetical protein K9J21_04935 [Bacteroidales bacterium]|nr:hypothetical protein [Bacteroidales bacterium]
MHREIIWSPLAEKDLGDILEYLTDRWDQQVIILFLSKVDYATNQIALMR